MTGETVLVVAGGSELDPELVTGLPTPDYVIAADSGLEQAELLGIRVDLVIGDLDSASRAAVARARESGIGVLVHPEDKDQTDLELALSQAAGRRPERVIVVGGGGARLDHFLANAGLLAHSEAAPALEWHTEGGRLLVVRDRVRVRGPLGGLITLLAAGVAAEGVHTQGLRWELQGDRLEPGSTRGVSNRFRKPEAEISVEGGTLLVIIPRA